MTDFYVVEPCSTANAYEIKLKDRKLDLRKCENALSKIGKVAGSSSVVLLAKIGKFSVSVYASGRLMVKSGRRLEGKAVSELAKQIIECFESEGAFI